MSNTKYAVEIAAGCYTTAEPPVISRPATWDGAVRKALKSDRLVAVDLTSGKRFCIPAQNDKKLGAGRYGNGITLTRARQLGLI